MKVASGILGRTTIGITMGLYNSEFILKGVESLCQIKRNCKLDV